MCDVNCDSTYEQTMRPDHEQTSVLIHDSGTFLLQVTSHVLKCTSSVLQVYSNVLTAYLERTSRRTSSIQYLRNLSVFPVYLEHVLRVHQCCTTSKPTVRYFRAVLCHPPSSPLTLLTPSPSSAGVYTHMQVFQSVCPVRGMSCGHH